MSAVVVIVVVIVVVVVGVGVDTCVYSVQKRSTHQTIGESRFIELASSEHDSLFGTYDSTKQFVHEPFVFSDLESTGRFMDHYKIPTRRGHDDS